jgi:hypothetical protein
MQPDLVACTLDVHPTGATACARDDTSPRWSLDMTTTDLPATALARSHPPSTMGSMEQGGAVLPTTASTTSATLVRAAIWARYEQWNDALATVAEEHGKGGQALYLELDDESSSRPLRIEAIHRPPLRGRILRSCDLNRCGAQHRRASGWGCTRS